jgi:hypothetical protein
MMIKNNEASVFDREQVHKGDLIRAKHQTWDEHRNGVVVGITDSKLIVLYYTGYGNVSNHYTMLASEVGRGEWQGTWTSDMETMHSIEQGGDDA